MMQRARLTRIPLIYIRFCAILTILMLAVSGCAWYTNVMQAGKSMDEAEAEEEQDDLLSQIRQEQIVKPQKDVLPRISEVPAPGEEEPEVEKPKEEPKEEPMEDVVPEEKEVELVPTEPVEVTEPTMISLSPEQADIVIDAKTGDTILLGQYLKVSNPDSQVITTSFTTPFNDNGVWTPGVDDIGNYTVIARVQAASNVDTAKILVRVTSQNQPPVIQIEPVLEYKETDLIDLSKAIKAFDPEGKDIKISFSGWMESPRKKTSYDSAGEYRVTVGATDGAKFTFRTITVIVKNVNRPPVMQDITPDKWYLKVGDTIRAQLQYDDPDVDDVSSLVVSYPEGFSDDGEWTPTDEDVGEQTLVFTVSDKYGAKDQTETMVIINPQNFAPTIELREPLVFNENSSVDLEPYFLINDPDGDELEVTYSGWATSERVELGFEDEGKGELAVTATDGKETTTKLFGVVVNHVPRPIKFVLPSE